MLGAAKGPESGHRPMLRPPREDSAARAFSTLKASRLGAHLSRDSTEVRPSVGAPRREEGHTDPSVRPPYICLHIALFYIKGEGKPLNTGPSASRWTRRPPQLSFASDVCVVFTGMYVGRCGGAPLLVGVSQGPLHPLGRQVNDSYATPPSGFWWEKSPPQVLLILMH